MDIECPSCEKNMETIEYEGIRIEQCLACRGYWLDHDELKKITDIRERRFNPLEREAIAAAASYAGTTSSQHADRDLLCPKCGSRTDPLNYGGTASLVLDKCPGCAGFWLDPGELEHVQQLVEGWQDLLPDDLAGHRERLHDVEYYSKLLDETRDVKHSQLPTFGRFINACVNGVFDLLG